LITGAGWYLVDKVRLAYTLTIFLAWMGVKHIGEIVVSTLKRPLLVVKNPIFNIVSGVLPLRLFAKIG
jgi:hypothetical protein